MKFLVVLALLGVVSAFKAAMPRARSTKLSVSFDTPTSRPYVDDPNEKLGPVPEDTDLDWEQSGLVPNRIGDPWAWHNQARPRRNRKKSAIRDMVKENFVTPRDLLLPLFIHDGDKEEISTMPGIYRHSAQSLMEEIEESVSLGINSFILFPKVSDDLKSNYAEESYNPEGIVPSAIQLIKARFPHVVVCTDVALDPYSDQGHDGVVDDDGTIANDITVTQLCKQAIMQARAGADIVAPSDMMDGRVGAIRDALDYEGFTDVSILSYTAKYASAFYGPFRDALGSHPGFGDKKTYQQDPANGREALIEMALDVAEGADMLMVKPGLPYLDVILRLRQNSNLPIAAYHVSGEYGMIKAAAEKGVINEKEAVFEALTCFKRAGADIILSYYAKQAAQWMYEDGLY